MDRYPVILIFGVWQSLWLVVLPSCYASIQITSVNRGVHVHGLTLSNSSTGIYNAELSNVSETRRGSARLESDIQDGYFSAFGSAEEVAFREVEELADPDVTYASAFLEVSFTASAPHNFLLQGWLIGITEDEHYRISLSLIGPGVNLDYSVGAGSDRVINEIGTLGSGDYAFAVMARTQVVGGLDGGSAQAYFSTSSPDRISTTLELSRIVPECSSVVVWTLLCAAGMAWRSISSVDRQRRSGRTAR